MGALPRVLHAIAGWFEYRASSKELAARIEKLEVTVAQCRVDMAKCKMMVGLNSLTEVTAGDV